MLETQHRWYKPALGTLGWHIGFWNLIGAIGFTVRLLFYFQLLFIPLDDELGIERSLR